MSLSLKRLQKFSADLVSGVPGASAALGLAEKQLAPAEAPPIAAAPAAPSADAAQNAESAATIAAAAEEERKRLRAQRGRASTILTGGAGLMDQPNLASMVLLG